MIFVLSIITVFVFISIYFFIRAEGLQREIITMKREVTSTKKDNREYIEAMAVIAQRYEDIYKKRFAELRESSDKSNEMFSLIAPLINNYAVIFNDSLRGNGKLHDVVKKTFEGGDKHGYKNFTNFIAQADASTRQAWSSNSINGYIVLVEMLLQVDKTE